MGRGFNLNDYITVDERIDRFWAAYPNGAIRTEMIYCNNDGTSVAFRASVHKDAASAHPDATGIAQEYQGKGANQTSWWENGETSAIGRALANMGMSISKQRPSREEMAKVQRHQSPPPAPTLDTAQVLTILREMDEAREPWHHIKQYADEQSAGRSGDDALRIHDALRAIAARRKAQ